MAVAQEVGSRATGTADGSIVPVTLRRSAMAERGAHLEHFAATRNHPA